MWNFLKHYYLKITIYKKIILWIIRFAISLSVLIIIFNKVDIPATIVILNTTNYYYFALAFIIKLLGTIFSAKIWQYSLMIFGENVHFKILFKYYLISYFFNNITPGTIGGDLARISNIVRSNGYKKSIGSVVLERSIGFTILVFIVTFSSLYIYIVYNLSSFLFIFLPVMLLLLIMWYYIINTNNIPIFKINLPVLKFENKYFLCGMLVFSLLFYLTAILSIWAITKSISIYTIPFYYYFVFVPLIIFLITVPISIQGLGVREIAFIYFLSFYNVGTEEAVAVSFLSFTLMLAISIMSFLLYIIQKLNLTFEKSNI